MFSVTTGLFMGPCQPHFTVSCLWIPDLQLIQGIQGLLAVLVVVIPGPPKMCNKFQIIKLVLEAMQVHDKCSDLDA